MQTLWQDLRYGARILVRNPGFTLIAVLSLSLGIGANSAVFSLIDAVLLRPLSVTEPHRLVALTTSDNHSSFPYGLSYRDYLDFRDNKEAFTGAMAYQPVSLNLASAGQSGVNERIWGVMTSGNYFDVLGVHAAKGRTFAPDEGRIAGTHPVAVISYDLWQRRFGGEESIIGKQMLLNGHNFTIIGVAPANFIGTEVIFTPAVWVPAQMHQQVVPGSAGILEARGAHQFRVWARLKAGVSQEQAQTAASLQARQLEQAYPATNKSVNVRLYPQWEARMEPGTGQVMAGAAALLMALVFIVLLIACANVANLMLSRVAGRRKEISIRLAIGANRWRLIRQLLTESFLIALLGGVAALLLALWGADLIASLRPSGDIPIGLSARLDGRVLGFTVLAASLTTFLSGLAPAWQASRADLVPALKGEEIAPAKLRRFSLRNVLVAAQVAMSAVLLLYLPHEQRYNGAMTLVVKTSTDVASVAAALRREAAALDPSLPLSGVRTIEDFLQARTYFGPRLISSLLGIFGLIGLLLAVIGIYGVMSYLVAQRTREIGVRRALGATSRNVLTMVVRQGMTVAALGLGAGVLAALALTRLMAGLLYGISATDPLTFLTIPLALALAALLACWIPARRATKVDPMVALRCE